MKLSFGLLASIILAVCQPQIVLSASDRLPIFFFHGFRLTHTDFNYMVGQLKGSRTVHALTACEAACTDLNGWEQIGKILAEVRNVIKANPQAFANGYHFVGHSWGAVLARGVMQVMNEHKVVKLISLDGSQSGASYYGNDKNWPDKLKALAKDMGITLANSNDAPTLLKDLAHQAYTPAKQTSSWRAGFFHVPTWDYLNKNEFIAVLNNVYEGNQASIGNHNKAFAALKTSESARRANFLKVKQFVLFHTGSKNPLPNSQLFGSYKPVKAYTDAFVAQDPKQSDEYAKDTFGLKTLAGQGKLVETQADASTPHMCWVVDNSGCKTADVFKKYVLPALDRVV
ncbi:Alpha/Beta hydrolase protein [Powellomyces hirtus]|nr:Alpha/Beta hydrolase protein [Powellomyces hirtus]